MSSINISEILYTLSSLQMYLSHFSSFATKESIAMIVFVLVSESISQKWYQ